MEARSEMGGVPRLPRDQNRAERATPCKGVRRRTVREADEALVVRAALALHGGEDLAEGESVIKCQYSSDRAQ